jgi:hypothetical protein
MHAAVIGSQPPTRYIGGHGNQVALTVLLAFVGHTADQMGAKLYIDAPPAAALSAAAASSNALATNYIFYNTTTDELIEAPVPDRDQSEQSQFWSTAR